MKKTIEKPRPPKRRKPIDEEQLLNELWENDPELILNELFPNIARTLLIKEIPKHSNGPKKRK